MSNQIKPSEHYMNVARVIVKQLCPQEQSIAEQHEKVMFVFRQIASGILDAPPKIGACPKQH